MGIEDQFEFEIDIVSHCNAKCYSCMRYSPLAEPWFITFEEFKKNVDLLCKHLGVPAHILLFGGEALLHPEWDRLADYACSANGNYDVVIVSNGLLVDKEFKKFLKVRHKHPNFKLRLTEYPFSKSIVSFYGNLDGVQYSDDPIKNWCEYRWLDTERDWHPYIPCTSYCSKRSVPVRDGKVYSCPQVAFIDRYNKYFGTNIQVPKDHFVELKEGVTYKDIIEMLDKEKTLCKYHKIRNIPWKSIP